MSMRLKTVLVSGIILLLFFLYTSPDRLPSAFLIVPFLLIFILFLSAGLLILGRLGATKRVRLRVSLLVASVPVCLLILQSLGQLTLRDCLVIFVLVVMVYFYVLRFNAQPAG